MRLPRVRFTMRGMMIAVAVAALGLFAARRYLEWREVRWWIDVGNGRPIGSRGVFVNLAKGYQGQLLEGQEVAIDVKYDFALTKPIPPPGMTFLVWVEMYFVDIKTGKAVGGYTFDVPLTTGGREQASGAFTWKAPAPRPGRYMLRHKAKFLNPLGEWRDMNGGGAGFDVIARPADAQG